ncbi:hypothetical protein ACLB2K_058697 [Fragaria x ananassa]
MKNEEEEEEEWLVGCGGSRRRMKNEEEEEEEEWLVGCGGSRFWVYTNVRQRKVTLSGVPPLQKWIAGSRLRVQCLGGRGQVLVGGEALGRVVIALFGEVVPETVIVHRGERIWS